MRRASLSDSFRNLSMERRRSSRELKVLIPEEWKTRFRRETKAVAYLRYVVLTVLVVAAVLMSVGVYAYNKLDEQQEFEDAFSDISRQVVAKFQEAVYIKLGHVNNLAVSITSYGVQKNMTFPFVTLPHFAQMGSGFRVAAETFILQYLPLVTDENRNKWEQYALEHRFHVDETYHVGKAMNMEQDAQYGLLQDEEDDHRRNLAQGAKSDANVLQDEDDHSRNLAQGAKSDPNVLTDGSGYHLRIWANQGIGPEPNGTGPFSPIWQSSPTNARRQFMINFNFDRGKAFRGVPSIILKTKKAVISKMDIPRELGHGNVRDNLLLSQYRHVADVYGGEPITFLSYPVFTDFSDDGEVGGILVTNIYWKLVFSNLLSASTEGIICVLENSFNQTVAYRIDGPDATFLGEGDPHDSVYDNLEVLADMTSYVDSRAGPENRAYTTLPLDMESGRYKLRVFPSKDFQNKYSTNKPIVYSVLVASVFLVTSLVFVAFSCFVEHRQHIVLERAVQSGTIVSSLFPKKVRDRLYDSSSMNFRESLNNFSTDCTDVDCEQVGCWGSSTELFPKSNDPIADLYPMATIMFADLAGFSAWSSERPPAEVFSLLEALHGQFDVIAENRNVFKVETIGDCYVCVTGVPEPQVYHAVIIAQFAKECMNRMETMLQDLVESLGEDTALLQMRVGLHSGSVIGGVLRGQKSRFQLFGDTINTTSRMETTGKPGKIHVSQATADALIEAGKKHWLTPRQDVVVAKGKGALETYWVTVDTDFLGDCSLRSVTEFKNVKLVQHFANRSNLLFI